MTGKGIIEPQIKLQWFVDVNKPVVDWKGKKQSLKEVMQDVVRSGDITIAPGRFDKIYFHWIDNLRDWCISRQIWWGHRIPVWYRRTADGEETYVGVQAPPDDGKEGWSQWEQDPDTLDTWFSSALWTWSTLVDQDLAQDYTLSLEELLQKSTDFQTYHPTNVMETGWDILFFWVARMILATTYVTGQLPFKTVYLHGMVRAEDGKKMSKSRPESVVNPLDVIAQYGTDALRMGLIMGVAPGTDQNWSKGRIEASRNFCNKLWNIARFIEDKLGSDYKPAQSPKAETIADEWVLSKLQHAVQKIGSDLDNYRFSEAYDTLYHFVWDDFADWYIEASKIQLNRDMLAYGLETILKLAHPFAPFVSETIWQTLGWQTDTLLITSPWPQPVQADSKKAGEFETIRSLVSEIRFINTAVNASKPRLYHKGDEFIAARADLIKHLAGLSEVKSVSDGNGLHLTTTNRACWLDLDSSAIQRFLNQLKDKYESTERSIAQLESRLANKAYTDKAPADLVNETRRQLAENRELLTKQKGEYERFKQ